MANKSHPRIIKLPIDIIEFPDYNPREISPKEFKKLFNDIKSDPNFLLQRPPLINHITEENKYVCYAGTQRAKAAIENGNKEIDVWVEDNVIEPDYCSIIIQRYLKHCKNAKREAIVKINGIVYGNQKEA